MYGKYVGSLATLGCRFCGYITRKIYSDLASNGLAFTSFYEVFNSNYVVFYQIMCYFTKVTLRIFFNEKRNCFHKQKRIKNPQIIIPNYHFTLISIIEIRVYL